MNIKSFAKSSGILIISNVILKAINFFLMPIYTQHLTTEMLGISDTITSFTGLLFPILVMGLDSAFSAFYYDQGDEQAKRVFNSIFFFLLIIGFIPILMCSFSGYLSYILFNTKEYSLILFFALISISFNIWYIPFALNLRMKNKMLLYSIINIIASFCMVIMNILFVAVLKLGTVSLILSTMIVHIIQCVLFVIANRIKVQRMYFDWNLLKKMIKFAIPLIPGTVLSWILSLSDRYILLYFHGAQAVGLYGIGTRIMTILNIFVSSVSMAYTTFAYGSKSDVDAKHKYIKVFDFMVLVLTLICFTLSLFSKEVVAFMTTSSYYSSYVVVRDLLFAQLFYGITTIVSYGILFEKKSGYTLLANACGAIFNIVFNVLLIPQFGISAAAFTTLSGYLITFLCTFVFAQKLYPCKYDLKRALLILVSVYSLAFFSVNNPLVFRIILWILTIIIILFVYRNTIIDLYKLVIPREVRKMK